MPTEGFWAGVSKGLFGKVKFGGVVGKICLMFSVTSLAAAFALRGVGDNIYGIAAAAFIVLCGLVVVIAMLVFSHLHPDLALTEGGEWLQYQELIQTKGGAPALPGPPEEDPLIITATKVPVEALPASLAEEESEDGQ